MISRRPKRRASIEYAPGPSSAIAAAMITTKKIVSFAPNRFGSIVVKYDSETTMPPSANRALASGVNSPISSKLPHTIAKQQTAQVAIVEFERPETYVAP